MNTYNIGYKIATIIYDNGNSKNLFLDPENIKTEKNNNSDSDEYKPQSFKRPICKYCKKSYYSNWDLKVHQNKSCKMKMMHEMYDDFIREKSKFIKEIHFDNAILIPYPIDYKSREILYICGPQGSGKSYYAAQYIKQYLHKFPNRGAILFSRIQKDKAFKGIKKLYRIDLEKLLDTDIDIKNDLKGSLCIFDDIEMMNKDIYKILESLKNDIIKNGRDQEEKGNDIHCIVTNHQCTDYRSTRDILNECTSITIFPRSSIPYNIKRLLNQYLGFDKKIIKKILSLNSRWVTIYIQYPQYVLYEHGAFLLSD